MPRRSRAMSIDSLSTPGTDTLVMWGEQGGLEPIAEPRNARDFLLALGLRQLHRARQSDDRGDVFGSRSPTSVLVSAVEQRLERSSAPDVHRAAALRCANFMT